MVSATIGRRVHEAMEQYEMSIDERREKYLSCFIYTLCRLNSWICETMCLLIICLTHPSRSVTVCTGCVKCWNLRRENCCEKWRQRKTLCSTGKPGCAREQSTCRRKERGRGRRWLLRSLINSSGSNRMQIQYPE